MCDIVHTHIYIYMYTYTVLGKILMIQYSLVTKRVVIEMMRYTCDDTGGQCLHSEHVLDMHTVLVDVVCMYSLFRSGMYM